MFGHLFPSQSIRRRCLRILAPLAAGVALLALPSQAWGVYDFTVTGNSNIFPSTTVGLTMQQTVHVTLSGSSVAIKSIVLQSAGATVAGVAEYTLGTVTNCTVDPTGATISADGTVCDIPVTYAPAYPGSLASPLLSRNATLVLTDGNGTKWTFALTGAATGSLVELVPGTISRYAGQPYTTTGINPLDNGLGYTTAGYGGDNGPAASAQFNFPANGYSLPQQMAFDSAGNLYVADAYNYIIRKIDTTSNHNVTTIAGTPQTSGYSGDNGPATSAKLTYPLAITMDAAGDIYFLDSTYPGFADISASVRLRRIDAVTGIITSVAGQNYSGTYDATDGGGACTLSGAGLYTCGDGGLASYADLYGASNIAIDPSGNIYLWSLGANSIREITASNGKIDTIASAAAFGLPTDGSCSYSGRPGMTLAADGNLYVVSANCATGSSVARFITEYNLTTNPGQITNVASETYQSSYCAPTSAQGGFPAADLNLGFGTGQSGALSSDASGNLYIPAVMEIQNCTYNQNPAYIYRINLDTSTAYLVEYNEGQEGEGTDTGPYNAFNGYYILPIEVIPDSAGNLYVLAANQIAEISASNAALNYPYQVTLSQADYTTSADQVVTYANVGNASISAPALGFASTGSSPGTNFDLDPSPTIPTPPGNAANCANADEIAPNDACTLYLQFTPTLVGLLSDTLDIGSPAAQTVSLSGNAKAAPRIGISPSSLSFGNVPENTGSTQYVTISSTGTATLGVSEISSAGTNSSNFVVAAGGASPCSFSAFNTISLTAGSNCTIQVTFTPTAATSYAAYLFGTTAATASSSTLINLSAGKLIPFTGTGTSALTAQTITFNNPGAQTVGTPLTLSATATSNLTVAFASTTASVCTVSGTQATFLTTGTCTIDATQGGNSTYAAATMVPQSFTVNGEAQTITFNNPGAQTVGTPLALSATATSNLTVAFASTTASVCTVSGTQATFLATGTCTIDATQGGNGTYAAAPMVAQSFTVNGEAQTITFNNPGAQTVGTPLALSATATSNLTVAFASTTTGVCTVSGTQATFLTAGTCTIDATQGGNSTYAAATMVPQSFTVNGEAQTITFNNPGSQTVGMPLTLSATATSNLTVAFASTTTGVCTVSGTQATFLTAGTCTIDATQGGNSTYAPAAMVPQSFTVNAAVTTPTFTIASPTAPQTVQPGGTATYTINVTPVNGSYTGAVTLSVSQSTLPAGATASFSPNPVTPGSEGASSTLTIQTSTATASAAHSNWPLAMPLLSLAGLFFVPGKRRRRWLTLGVLLCASLGALTALSGCGGGFQLPGATSTPCNITVNGANSSGAIVSTTTVQLTVQ